MNRSATIRRAYTRKRRKTLGLRAKPVSEPRRTPPFYDFYLRYCGLGTGATFNTDIPENVGDIVIMPQEIALIAESDIPFNRRFLDVPASVTIRESKEEPDVCAILRKDEQWCYDRWSGLLLHDWAFFAHPGSKEEAALQLDLLMKAGCAWQLNYHVDRREKGHNTANTLLLRAIDGKNWCTVQAILERPEFRLDGFTVICLAYKFYQCPPALLHQLMQHHNTDNVFTSARVVPERSTPPTLPIDAAIKSTNNDFIDAFSNVMIGSIDERGHLPSVE